MSRDYTRLRQTCFVSAPPLLSSLPATYVLLHRNNACRLSDFSAPLRDGTRELTPGVMCETTPLARGDSSQNACLRFWKFFFVARLGATI